ncbi:MAG TPA: translocation/assembly module TamB domain-containing protein [Candidatus Eremiobacteraceae bacterium]|nr:translocation/assembly module TamB domain-containing protein [Candidatus Eremiobacteraceae bacterium]
MLSLRAVARGVVLVVGLAAACVLVGVSFQGPRSVLARFAFGAFLAAHGMHVSGGDLRLGTARFEASDLEIDDDTGRVLSIKHVTIDYDWRALIGRSDHRYGVRAIDVEQPALRLVVLPDGSTNLSTFVSGAPPSAGATHAGLSQAPLTLTLRIAGGRLDVENPSAYARPGRWFSVTGIEIDAALTGGVGRGDLRATYTAQGATSHIRGALSENDPVGFAQLTLDAPSVAFAPPLDALISSPQFVTERGTADVVARAYDAGFASGAGPSWRFSASARVHGGSIHVVPLDVPVRDLAGTLAYSGGYLGFDDVRGDAAGLPVQARGSIRLADGVRLGFVARTHGDLHLARRLLAFSRAQAVDGAFEARLRFDGPLHDVHVAGDVEGSTGTEHVDGIPLAAARARFYYHDAHLTLPQVEASYDGGRLSGGGDITLADEPAFQAIATAVAPARAVPVIANLNRGGIVQALASIDGPGSSARYYVFGRTLGGSGANAAITVAGIVGSSAFGALRIAWRRGDITARTAYDSSDPEKRAFFASVVASHAPVHIFAGSAGLPGILPLISLPEIDGTFDGVARSGGSDVGDGALATVVDLRGSDVVVHGERVDSVMMRASGSGPRVALQLLELRGRDVAVRAAGEARVDPRTLQVAGDVRGTGALALAPLARAAGIPASGEVRGDFETLFSASGWAATIAARDGDAIFDGLPLSGLTLEAAAGPAAPLRYAVRASALRGSIGAFGTSSGASIFASGIDMAALRQAGLPFDAGTAVLIGDVKPAANGAAISASVSVAHGRMHGTPVEGSGDIAYAGRDLRASGDVDVAGTRMRVRGSARGVAPGAALSDVTIDASASVRDGDLGAVLAHVLPPEWPVAGAFSADVALRGRASDPQLAGTLDSGAATLRGVTLLGNQSTFSYEDGAFTLRDGATQLGDSALAFGGRYSRDRLALRASSAHVDLSDVNSFFEGRDVLEGIGTADISLSLAPGGARAHGAIALADAYVAGVPLGSVSAVMRESGANGLHVDVAQNGELGASDVSGDLALSDQASAIPDLHRSTYRVDAQASDLDLGLLGRLTGLEDWGLRGTIDANGTLHGTFAGPAVDVAFAVHDGYVRKLQLLGASGHITSDGTQVQLRDAVVDVSFGHAVADARLRRNGALSGDAQLAVSDLRGLARLLGSNIDVNGAAQTQLALSGTVRKPVIVGSLTATPGEVLGIGYDQLAAHATYSANEVAIGDTLARLSNGRGLLTLSGSLPLELVPFALGPPSRPVDLRLDAAGIDIAAFDPLLKGAGALAGTLDANAAASGTAGKPELQGSARLRGGELTSRYQTVPLRSINADLVFSHDSITLTDLAGKAGSGSFSGSGRAYVVPAVGLRNTPGLAYYATLHAVGVPLDAPNWVSGTFNVDLGLTQSGSTPLLAGTVTLRDGTIPVSAIYQLATTLGDTTGPPPTSDIPGVPALLPGHTIVYGGGVYPPGQHVLTPAALATPAPTFFDLPSLNMQLAADARNVRVRGGPVDLTTDGNLAIGGSVRDPQLAGEFTTKRGTIGAYGVTFRVERGVLSFEPDQGVLPSLDATASTVVNGDRVTLDISGRVDHLNTVISSSSGQTPEQILAGIIGGSDVGALTGGVTQQTLSVGAQRLLSAELSRSILSPFSTALAQSLNIEEVSLEFNQLGQIVVEVRKFVSPTVAVIYGSTTSQPVTQYYGASYSVRDYAALEFTSTTAPSGFITYRVGMRVTFK